LPVVKNIRQNVSRLGKVKYVVVSYAFPQKQEIGEGEVYFLFVGTIVSPEVVKIFDEEETRYPHEINYTVMTEEEFLFRKKNADPFIWGFLHKPKIMIIGSESELMV
ncbi:MAG: hypothetical protein ACMG6E_01015, partial [Candidatus Roizmanbacteria bacterium]